MNLTRRRIITDVVSTLAGAAGVGILLNRAAQAEVATSVAAPEVSAGIKELSAQAGTLVKSLVLRACPRVSLQCLM